MKGIKDGAVGWFPLLVFDVCDMEMAVRTPPLSPISAPKRKETRLLVKCAEALLSQRRRAGSEWRFQGPEPMSEGTKLMIRGSRDPAEGVT